MSRNLYYLVICCYFSCTLAHSLNSAARSYRMVHTGDTGSGFFQAVQHVTDPFMAFPFLDRLARYAGIVTGYGFFAPQVGSSFQLEVSALDSSGDVVARADHPVFSHAHNRLRFHSLLNRLQHVQSGHISAAGDWSIRQARALSHCIAQRMANRQWGTRYATLRCTVSVYQHAALRAPETVHHMQRFIIYQHVIPNRYPS